MYLNRLNVFNQIHKGLRALLYDVALQIQQTDFTAKEGTQELVKEIEQVVHLFDEHAENEDSYILPMIGKYNPQLIESFENEHEEDHRLSQQLLTDINTWWNAANDWEKQKAGTEIFYHFNEFVAFNLYHMNREEKLLNEVLWTNYTDGEILAVEHEIVANIPPATLAVESRWMMKGMNNPEIIGWLKGVKQGAPEPVFQELLQLAEETLPAGRWEAVSEALSVGLGVE